MSREKQFDWSPWWNTFARRLEILKWEKGLWRTKETQIGIFKSKVDKFSSYFNFLAGQFNCKTPTTPIKLNQFDVTWIFDTSFLSTKWKNFLGWSLSPWCSITEQKNLRNSWKFNKTWVHLPERSYCNPKILSTNLQDTLEKASHRLHFGRFFFRSRETLKQRGEEVFQLHADATKRGF